MSGVAPLHPMKIVRIIARLNVGGPARHVVWLSKGLEGEGFTSLLIAGRVPEGEEDMGYLAQQSGVNPIFIEEMSRELSPGDVISLWKLYRLLLREKPDIVHTHTAKAGTVGRTAAFLYKWLTPHTLIGRPRKVKVVHTFHGHVFHSYYGKLKTSVFLTIERLLARFATDRIVVISAQQLDEINRRFRVGRSENFSVVPLGIDLAPLNSNPSSGAALRAEIGSKGTEILVGFVGRLTEIKNLPLFLEAAALSMKNADADAFRFVIAGDGQLRRELEKRAEELGVGGTVTFLGSREDVAAVYSALDIVALTSLNEGTPLSLIEAMAARRPVISTLVGGVVDLLGPVVEEFEGFSLRERGIGVGSTDPNDLFKGLIYLAKNEKLRLELASRGHEFVRANYGKDRLIEDIKRLYADLVP
jgi:glycosyltransferase involved in cell wall biosynthesis